MSRTNPALVLALFLLSFAPACATTPPRDDPARAPVIIVPTFTPAPPPPPPAPPPAPAAASLDPPANPACTLTSNNIEPSRAIPLRVNGSAPFFHVDKAQSLEVRLASPLSTAKATRADLEIIGHVQLSDVPVRLRSDALVDGYLRVRHAALRDGDPAHLELEVATPWFLKPVKEPALFVTCDEIILAQEIGHLEMLRGKAVDLREGAPIPLRATPGGPVVATVTMPKVDPLMAIPNADTFELERRGQQVRIRIEDDATDVEGWVSRKDLAPHAEVGLLAMLGALGGIRSTSITLASEAPLLVHSGDRVVRVGSARPGTFGCEKPANADEREIELGFDMGFGGLGMTGFGSGPGSGPPPAAAKLFVVPARGEACVESGGGSR